MTGIVCNMADVPRVVLRHNETKEFLVSVNEEGKIGTTTEKHKAKRFSGMGGANKFIEHENLEERWIPTPF